MPEPDEATSPALEGVSVIVPAFNEEESVADTIREIAGALGGTGRPFEIVVVDDAATDATARRVEECGLPVRLVRNDRNMGYGASIKRGIDETIHPLIAITDADGTYPNDRLPDLLDAVKGAEMAVGSRTGKNVNVPVLRRPAKWFIGRLASYLSGTHIPDINSGLRVMRRRSVAPVRSMLPDGFSLTTTITLALLCRGYPVRYVPIDYHKRKGTSSIRPIRDTLKFVQLIIRTVMYFQPLKVFLPLGLLFVLASVTVLTLGLTVLQKVPDITVILLCVTGIQIIVLGLVADLVDKRIG